MFRLSQGLGSFSHHPTIKEVGGHKELGGDTAGTADPNCPEGYSRTYGFMLNMETGRKVGLDAVFILSHSQLFVTLD